MSRPPSQLWEVYRCIATYYGKKIHFTTPHHGMYVCGILKLVLSSCYASVECHLASCNNVLILRSSSIAVKLET